MDSDSHNSVMTEGTRKEMLLLNPEEPLNNRKYLTSPTLPQPGRKPVSHSQKMM